MNTKSGHTQLPGRGVANVGPFARLSVKSTNECPEMNIPAQSAPPIPVESAPVIPAQSAPPFSGRF